MATGDNQRRRSKEIGQTIAGLENEQPAVNSAPTFSDDKTSKKEANYRTNNQSSSRRCGSCANFIADKNRCQLVSGNIRSQDVCDLWEPEEPETPEEGQLSIDNLLDSISGASENE